MWNESSTEDREAPTPPQQPEQDPSRAFLLSLRPQPGCEKDGVCNQCGLCEH